MTRTEMAEVLFDAAARARAARALLEQGREPDGPLVFDDDADAVIRLLLAIEHDLRELVETMPGA